MTHLSCPGRESAAARRPFERYKLPCALAIFLVLLALAPGLRAQSLELTSAQRQWVAAHKAVRVAPDPDLAPIDGVDAEGRQHGLSADYLKLIAARTGLEFHVVRVANRSDALRALAEHRADLMSAAAPGADGKQNILYTAPYLRLSAAVFARRGEPGFSSLDQLRGHSIALVASSPWAALLAAQDSSAKARSFPDIAAALNALRDKAVDAFVGDPFRTADALARLKLDQDIVLSGQLALETAVTLAVREDWPMLRDIINAALKTISVDDEKALRERWLKGAAAPAPATPAAPALPASHMAAIDAALQAAAKTRDADQRGKIEELLRAAKDDESAADEFAVQWQGLSQSSAVADAETQKLEDTLAQNDTTALLAWRTALPERASVEQLESLLARARDDLSAAKSSAATLQAEIDRQTLRPSQLRAELAAARAALDKSGEAAPAAGDGATAQAQRLRAQAAARRATIQIELLNLEDRTYESRMRLLAAQLRDRQRRISELNQHVATLENLVLDRTGAAAADLAARVAQERDRSVTEFRALGETANANVSLAEKLADSVHQLSQLHAEQQDWETWRRDTAQALKNTEERIRIGGVSEAVGLILLAEKSKLKSLTLLKRTLGKLQTDLAQTRINLIGLREQQTVLSDLGSAVDQALARMPAPPPERLNDVRTSVFRLLNTRADIVQALLLQQTRLATVQGDAEQTLHELVTSTDKLDNILDARLLWTPSHKPIDAAWFAQLSQDFGTFFGARRWGRVAVNVEHAIVAAPLTSAAAAIAFVLLVMARWRIAPRLEQLTTPMRRIRTDRLALTGKALLWTLMAAAPMAFALWMLAYLCRQLPSSGNLTEETAYAFAALVMPAYAVACLRVMMLENGLAQAHFRWPRPRREALSAAAPWFAVCVMPTLFVLRLLLLRGPPAPIDTVGRLLLALSAIGFAALAWRLFAPGRLWTVRGAVLAEPLRVRQTVRIAMSAGFVLMAGLVLYGYFVTVMTLSRHVIASLGVLLLIATVHGLAVRWLVLGERRLALKRLEEKQESAEEQRERDDAGAAPEPEPEEITIAAVGEQTRRLLRWLTTLAVLISLLWIWSDVTPALAMLDDIPVWKDENVTLLGVLEALIVLSLTWVATGNLPGLLEVSVLRRFNVDAPTRYAATTITRYIILFTGTCVGLALLGLRWSSFKWLAAGFSVGLGFGLQEIFANFISGLMVLFERPVRVGDVVSIGNVEGTVTRIRTRATTIVDADHREVIVPNKSFITERLTNWTLSDSITRTVTRVAVAYRSDPRLAQRLLLQTATAHPLVLSDPAPVCFLTGFGDNAQLFELQAWVAEINQRASVKNDLQMHIAEVFRENDIEIAFPQMDLWVRSPVQVHEDAPDKAAAPRTPSGDASPKRV
ncbi:MAG TPA: transporter substrate-binding domain-containing protein [Rudaea sp.]|nr:transporter substrate-binding domain-containing protein [Rudaea sp.]